MRGAERLSALDAAFVYLENDVQPLHVGSVLVFAGPAPEPGRLAAELAARLAPLAWHRRHIRRMPLDLGRPVWVSSERCGLDEHLHHLDLAAPGDDAALRDLVARLMVPRLAVSRPPFELWHVDGLSGGRWALVAKVHHALVDGASGMDLVGSLLAPPALPPGGAGWPSTGAGPGRVQGGPDPCAPPRPTRVDVALGGAGWLVALPLRAARLTLRSLVAPRAAVRRVRLVRHGLAQVVQPDLPPCVLNGPLGPGRLWGWAGAPLAEVEAVGRSAGATVNDVFLAAVAGGLRGYLLERGEPLDGLVARAIVPVSGRSAGSPVRPGNIASAMFVVLPVAVARPLARLALVHGRTEEQKSRAVADGTAAMVRAADHVPAPLLARAAGAYARAGQGRVNVAASGVTGPREVCHLAGSPLLDLLPYVPVALDVRATFALVTYAGRCTVGVTGDAASLPDLHRLVEHVDRALRELLDAPAAPAARGADAAPEG